MPRWINQVCPTLNFRYALAQRNGFDTGGTTVPASKSWQLVVGGLLLVLIGAIAHADDNAMQTDWMAVVKGSRDAVSGTEVVEVEDNGADGTRTVTLAIPKRALSDPAAIEEIVVIGKAPEKSEPMDLDISYEWIADYDEDNYGLVIRLGKETNWPIRLYLNSGPGFVR